MGKDENFQNMTWFYDSTSMKLLINPKKLISKNEITNFIKY